MGFKEDFVAKRSVSKLLEYIVAVLKLEGESCKLIFDANGK